MGGAGKFFRMSQRPSARKHRNGESNIRRIHPAPTVDHNLFNNVEKIGNVFVFNKAIISLTRKEKKIIIDRYVFFRAFEKAAGIFIHIKARTSDQGEHMMKLCGIAALAAVIEKHAALIIKTNDYFQILSSLICYLLYNCSRSVTKNQDIYR